MPVAITLASAGEKVFGIALVVHLLPVAFRFGNRGPDHGVLLQVIPNHHVSWGWSLRWRSLRRGCRRRGIRIRSTI